MCNNQGEVQNSPCVILPDWIGSPTIHPVYDGVIVKGFLDRELVPNKYHHYLDRYSMWDKKMIVIHDEDGITIKIKKGK